MSDVVETPCAPVSFNFKPEPRQRKEVSTETLERASEQARTLLCDTACAVQSDAPQGVLTPSESASPSHTLSEVDADTCRPQELAGRVLCLLDIGLDCRTLLRSACTCTDWARQGRLKVRWRTLCKADWGMTVNASRKEYKHQLECWQQMRATLGTLKGRGHPGNSFGSTYRRRLAKALEAVVDIGSAADPAATYPSQLLPLLRETEATNTMLALLDDESAHLVCLALRCLAEIAKDDTDRPKLRSQVDMRRTMFRSFLQEGDTDIVEATSRMLLNLYEGIPGTPVSVHRRGPAAFVEKKELKDPSAMAAPWTGLWVGQTHYARDGVRHSGLQIILGCDDDISMSLVGKLLETQNTLSENGEVLSSTTPYDAGQVRSENQCFMKLAGSGSLFDIVKSISFSQLQREDAAPPCENIKLTGSCLQGVGWEEQNGAFSVSVHLPHPGMAARAACTGVPCTQAGAVPLTMELHFKQRMLTTEIEGFLAECQQPGCADVPCVLYGVSGSARYTRHLFILKKVAHLGELCKMA